VEKNYLHPELVSATARKSRTGKRSIDTATNVSVLWTDYAASQILLSGMRKITQGRLGTVLGVGAG